jgi:hypothetical protein
VKVDEHIKEKSFLTLLQEEEDKLMTPTQKYHKKIGFTVVDTRPSNKGFGALGIFMVVFTAGLVIAIDIQALKAAIESRLFINLRIRQPRPV